MDVTSAATLTAEDHGHLQRCVELAAEALDDGDEPFGSVLVHDGVVLAEDRNRVSGGDRTQHPEFALARWAAANLSPADRADAIVYTSGEHCPMCSAAHAWVGLGPIVYIHSSEQLTQWRAELGGAVSPVAALPIHSVAPGVIVRGPVPAFEDAMRDLHRRAGAR